jgi:hypothetical protein
LNVLARTKVKAVPIVVVPDTGATIGVAFARFRPPNRTISTIIIAIAFTDSFIGQTSKEATG